MSHMPMWDLHNPDERGIFLSGLNGYEVEPYFSLLTLHYQGFVMFLIIHRIS
jgi:hypothetical protein